MNKVCDNYLVLNDCPLCGDELMYVYSISCKLDHYTYYDAIASEWIQIVNYKINRRMSETIIYFDQVYNTGVPTIRRLIKLNYTLPLGRFNTKEKIEKLLLLI